MVVSKENEGSSAHKKHVDKNNRRCYICKRELSLDLNNFYRDKSRLFGISYDCRRCLSERKRGKDIRVKRWSKMTVEEKERRKATQRKYARTDKGRALFLVSQYRKIDARKGRICDLTQQDLIEIAKKPCTYCKTEIGRRGCDRIDNKLGHTKSNTVPCCYECNSARMDNFTHEEMRHIGEAIARVREKRLEIWIR